MKHSEEHTPTQGARNITTSKPLLLLVACICALATPAFATTVSWDGGGDGVSWGDPANWSGNYVPMPTNDVVISGGAGSYVLLTGSSTVKSIQCSKELRLADAYLMVTEGASTISGTLTLAAGARLSVGGTGAVFTATGPVGISNANLTVVGGGTLLLAGLTSISQQGCGNRTWVASGAGSQLVLPALTNIISGDCGYQNVRAESGGTFVLTNLASTSGYVSMQVDGSASVGDLARLRTMTDCAWDTLLVNGAGQLLVPSLAVATNVAITVSGGGTLTLPSLPSAFLDSCGNRTWVASGAGSQLVLPALTNIISGDCGYQNVRAESGGTFVLTNLASTSGYVSMQVDGAGSVGNLARLRTMTDCAWNSLLVNGAGQLLAPSLGLTTNVSITVSGGGTLTLPSLSSAYLDSCGYRTWEANGTGSKLFLPALTNMMGGDCGNYYVRATAGGRLTLTNLVSVSGSVRIQADGADSVGDLPRLRVMSGTGVPSLNVSGAGVLLVPALAVTTNAELTVSDGGNLMLPSLASAWLETCGYRIWEANGVGSQLVLPALTNIVGGDCGDYYVRATSGGRLVLNNLISVSGSVRFQADGANTLMELPQLTSVTGTPASASFTARNGGAISLATTAALDGNVQFVADGTNSVVNLNRLTTLTGTGGTPTFTVKNGGTMLLPEVVEMQKASLYVSGGGTLWLPNLRNYQDLACGWSYWEVSGVGSVLNLPALTNLVTSDCAPAAVHALSGGQVVLTNLATVDGIVDVVADGTNSVVDLAALTTVTRTNGSASFTAKNGGTTWMPALATMETASLYVSGGGNLWAPNLHSYQQTGYPWSRWQASGTGSVLVLPALRNVMARDRELYVEAMAGGQVVLTNLATVDGNVDVVADGTNSVVDLAALTSVTRTNGSASFTARNGGTAWMPALATMETASLYVSGGGTLWAPNLHSYRQTGYPWSEWQASGTGSALVLPSLMDVMASGRELYIEAMAGGQVVLTNLANVDGNVEVVADGTNSVVDLSRLTTVTAINGSPSFTALSGGWVDLRGVRTLYQGNLAFTSDGIGSVIDLRELSAFVLPSGRQGKLEAKNGGVILFNNQAFLLANVAVSIPAGDPLMPPLVIASPTVTLYGKAWHSYWVEQRDIRSETNGWQFLARVPLTNGFQTFMTKPSVNMAYQIREFIADPSIVDLWRPATADAQVVLYGATNKTYAVEWTTNLKAVVTWHQDRVATMTNTFRIFPPEPIIPPARFFRSKEL